jgi:hypothetical protein
MNAKTLFFGALLLLLLIAVVGFAAFVISSTPSAQQIVNGAAGNIVYGDYTITADGKMSLGDMQKLNQEIAEGLNTVARQRLLFETKKSQLKIDTTSYSIHLNNQTKSGNCYVSSFFRFMNWSFQLDNQMKPGECTAEFLAEVWGKTVQGLRDALPDPLKGLVSIIDEVLPIVASYLSPK